MSSDDLNAGASANANANAREWAKDRDRDNAKELHRRIFSDGRQAEKESVCVGPVGHHGNVPIRSIAASNAVTAMRPACDTVSNAPAAS